MEETKGTGLVRLILGDTLNRDPFNSQDDFVYLGRVDDSRRWCIAVVSKADRRVLDYQDKIEDLAPPLFALSGYYHLQDRDLARKCAIESINDGARELSAVLRRYGQQRPIYARMAEFWLDFGNADKLLEARRYLLQSRCFNTLEINPILNTITKESDDNQKLQDELDWYLNIPDDLKVLTPRVVKHFWRDNNLVFIQEYYGYPTLAELYLYSDLHLDDWVDILGRILKIHREFKRHSGHLEFAEIEEMFLPKTNERINRLISNSPIWEQRFQREIIYLNGKKLLNWPLLLNQLTEITGQLAHNAEITIIHGDLCFGNILFDYTHRIIRLIDPRGRFGRKGIFGDPRYDIAKLRHSISGLYDYIVADLFDATVEDNDSQYSLKIFTNGIAGATAAVFDAEIVKMGYQLNDIKIIEGLLFISMLPLHKDQPRRQIAMWLTGLSLLNEVLNANRD